MSLIHSNPGRMAAIRNRVAAAFIHIEQKINTVNKQYCDVLSVGVCNDDTEIVITGHRYLLKDKMISIFGSIIPDAEYNITSNQDFYKLKISMH